MGIWNEIEICLSLMTFTHQKRMEMFVTVP